jgi:hypothetical protein
MSWHSNLLVVMNIVFLQVLIPPVEQVFDDALFGGGGREFGATPFLLLDGRNMPCR